MKKLILVRHAKSSWADWSISDHDRPLNGRGRRDAPFMGQLLASRYASPPVLMSSTAKRAQTTAQHFAKAMGYTPTDVHLEAAIYEANTIALQQVIAQLNDEWDNVALFGHNPGFTMLANLFYEANNIDNLPTCGIVEINGETVERWADFSPETARVETVHFPKQYQ